MVDHFQNPLVDHFRNHWSIISEYATNPAYTTADRLLVEIGHVFESAHKLTSSIQREVYQVLLARSKELSQDVSTDRGESLYKMSKEEVFWRHHAYLSELGKSRRIGERQYCQLEEGKSFSGTLATTFSDQGRKFALIKGASRYMVLPLEGRLERIEPGKLVTLLKGTERDPFSSVDEQYEVSTFGGEKSVLREQRVKASTRTWRRENVAQEQAYSDRLEELGGSKDTDQRLLASGHVMSRREVNKGIEQTAEVPITDTVPGGGKRVTELILEGEKSHLIDQASLKNWIQQKAAEAFKENSLAYFIHQGPKGKVVRLLVEAEIQKDEVLQLRESFSQQLGDVLGRKGNQELLRERENSSQRKHLTQIDRLLLSKAVNEKFSFEQAFGVGSGTDPFMRERVRQRLSFLAQENLVQKDGDTWRMEPKFEDKLRQLSRFTSVRDSLEGYNAANGKELSTVSHTESPEKTVIGQVIKIGVEDERTRRRFALIQDVRGEQVHLVLNHFTLPSGVSLRGGDLVKVESTSRNEGPHPTDHWIFKATSEEGGEVTTGQVLQVVNGLTGDKEQREKYREVVLRRLYRLVNIGIIENPSDDRYIVPKDLLETLKERSRTTLHHTFNEVTILGRGPEKNLTQLPSLSGYDRVLFELKEAQDVEKIAPKSEAHRALLHALTTRKHVLAALLDWSQQGSKQELTSTHLEKLWSLREKELEKTSQIKLPGLANSSSEQSLSVVFERFTHTYTGLEARFKSGQKRVSLPYHSSLRNVRPGQSISISVGKKSLMRVLQGKRGYNVEIGMQEERQR